MKKLDDIWMGAAIVSAVIATLYMVYPSLFWTLVYVAVGATLIGGCVAAYAYTQGKSAVPTIGKLKRNKRKDMEITL